MSKLLAVVVVAVIGLAAVAAASPMLLRLVHAFVVLVLTIGVVVLLVRLASRFLGR